MSRLWISSVFLLLPACALNAIRLESGGALADASAAVVDASRASLSEARVRRQRANTVVVASDPSCPAARIIHIRLLPGALCADVASADTIDFNTQPLSQSELQPTLTLIAGLADYSAALNKIVKDPKPDVSAELGALAKKAGEATAIANALLGSEIPTADKALASDQAQAALKLVQFAAELAHEAEQVEKLRALFKARDPEIATLTAELYRQINTWNQMAKIDAQTTVGQLDTVYNSEVRKRPFEQRLAFVELINAARADVSATDDRATKMVQAVKLLDDARQELTRNLEGHPDQKTRERIARMNQARILGAIKLLASAIAAF